MCLVQHGLSAAGGALSFASMISRQINAIHYATGNNCLLSRHAMNHSLNFLPDALVETFETIPCDGALEGVHDDAQSDRRVAPVGHANEGLEPDAGGPAPMLIAARIRHRARNRSGVVLASMIAHQFERTL